MKSREPEHIDGYEDWPALVMSGSREKFRVCSWCGCIVQVDKHRCHQRELL